MTLFTLLHVIRFSEAMFSHSPVKYRPEANYLIQAATSLAAGGLLYLLFQGGGTVFFTIDSGVTPPSWIKYHLADGLWAYSFNMAVAAIQYPIFQRNRFQWIFLCPGLALFFEVSQHLSIFPGTFDVYDIIFYFVFWALSCVVIRKIQYANQK